MRPLLTLVDGDHLFKRNVHKFENFNHNGMMTGGFYGTINSMNKIANMGADEVCVLWGDFRGNLWRRKEYTEYKAKRDVDVDPVKVKQERNQLQAIFSMFDKLAVTQLKVDTQEADDLIAHICNKQKQKFNIIILTGDKDLRQLIREENDEQGYVHVLTEGKGTSKTYNVKTFTEEYGFGPEQLVEFLSVVGDKSDGIPGVSGVGAKGALKHILGQANSRIKNKIAACDDLDLFRRLIDLTNTNINNIVNSIPKSSTEESYYDLLVKFGCQGSLDDKCNSIYEQMTIGMLPEPPRLEK